MTVRELLIKGRARVAAGWCQGKTRMVAQDMMSGEISTLVCTYGGIADCPNTTVFCAAFNALQRFTSPLSIVEWNDRRGRTQADVLSLYDRAIASLEPDPPALFHADDAAFLAKCRAVAVTKEEVTL